MYILLSAYIAHKTLARNIRNKWCWCNNSGDLMKMADLLVFAQLEAVDRIRSKLDKRVFTPKTTAALKRKRNKKQKKHRV